MSQRKISLFFPPKVVSSQRGNGNRDYGKMYNFEMSVAAGARGE